MPAQIDPKTGEELKESPNILNIAIMILGLVFIFQAVLLILAWAGVESVLPQWVIDLGSGTEAVSQLIGSDGLVTLVLGVWLFIAGIGLFQEQEWAWGMALIDLSIIITNSVTMIIGWFTGSGFAADDVITWVNLIGFIFAAVAFVFLLVTKKRYA